MENEPQLRLGSPAKQAALAAGIADSPPVSDDWSLKAHGGSVSRIPKPAPLTPSDQGIKGKVSRLGGLLLAAWACSDPPTQRFKPRGGSRRPTARCLPHARAAPPQPSALQTLFNTPVPTPSQPGLREEALKKIEAQLEARLLREKALLKTAAANGGAAAQKLEVCIVVQCRASAVPLPFEC
jgi:hypothetical protein